MSQIAATSTALSSRQASSIPAAKPTDRASIDGHLVSLVVPVPGQEGVDFESVLFSYAQSLKPHYLEADDAALAIVALDRSDCAPDLAVAQRCMGFLLTLGQHRLMVRLAEKCPLEYSRSFTKSAPLETLAKAIAFWPKGAPLSIGIANTLPAGAASSLREILAKQQLVKLRLLSFGIPEPAAWAALADELRPHTFPILQLDFGPQSVESLRALTGIGAEKICIGEDPVRRSAQADWDAYGSVLATLIERSGARQLAVQAQSFPGEVIARMVSARKRWETVEIPFTSGLNPGSFGECSIDRLQLNLGGHMLQPTPEFMQALRASKVREVVVDGLFDVSTLGLFLQSTLGKGFSLTLLQGTLVYRDGSDIRQTLLALAHDLGIERVVHTQRHVDPPPGYQLLSPQDAQFLEAQNVSNQALIGRRLHGDATENAGAWDRAVKVISHALKHDLSAQALLDHLNTSQNMSVSFHDLSWMPPELAHAIPLAYKLKLFQAYDFFPEQQIRDAVQYRLHEAPTEASGLCQAMIVARYPSPKCSTADWMRMKADNKQQWTLANKDPLFQDRFAPAELIGSGGTTTTTTAATTTTTTATNTTTTAATSTAIAPVSVSGGAQTVHAKAAEITRRLYESLSARSKQNVDAFIAGTVQRNPHVAQELNGFLIELFHYGRLTSRVQNSRLTEPLSVDLLRNGEFELLRYMATLFPRVLIYAWDANDIQRLAQLSDTVNQGGQYTLALHTNAPAAVVDGALAFAASLPVNQLTISLHVEAGTEAQFLSKAANFLLKHAGLRLYLTQNGQDPLLTWHLARFLDAIPANSLSAIGFDRGLRQVDDSLLKRVSAAVVRSGATKLLLGWDIGPQAADMLLASRTPWQEIDIALTPEHKAHFKAGKVSTPLLRITHTADVDIDDALSATGLETLELSSLMTFPFLEMARRLHRAQGIRFVKCALTFTDERQFLEGLDLLMRRPPLHLEITNDVASDYARRLQKALLGRSVRDPSLAIEGVGKGWTYGIATALQLNDEKGALFDALGRIGRFLDPQSARALAQTHKAAYDGYMQAWRSEVSVMAGWLSPTVSYDKFQKYLLDRVNGQSPYNHLGGSLAETHPGQLALSKAIALHAVGMPSDAIAMAIRLQLNEELNEDTSHAQGLLEALAYIDAIPASVWLKDVYGIGVSVQPALQG